MLEKQHIGADVRFSLRTLHRSPGFTAVAVLALALGIGASTALFSVVNAILLRSLGYDDPVHLLQISGRNKQGQQTGVSAADFEVIRQRAHSFAQIGAARFESYTLIGPHEPESVYGQIVSRDCFAALGGRAGLGRTFAPTDFEPSATPVLILSHAFWEKGFSADPKVIGRHVLLNGHDAVIIGVMAPEFQFPHPAFSLWTAGSPNQAELAARRPSWYQLVARLRPGVSQQAAQAELQAISESLAREFPQTNTGWRAIAQPIDEQLPGEFAAGALHSSGRRRTRAVYRLPERV